MVIMVSFVLMRVYVKARLSKSFGIDDWTSIIAGLFGIGIIAVTLSLMTNPGVGPHMWDEHFTAFLNVAFSDVRTVCRLDRKLASIANIG
jgi:hypothetical protein